VYPDQQYLCPRKLRCNIETQESFSAENQRFFVFGIEEFGFFYKYLDMNGRKWTTLRKGRRKYSRRVVTPEMGKFNRRYATSTTNLLNPALKGRAKLQRRYASNT